MNGVDFINRLGNISERVSASSLANIWGTVPKDGFPIGKLGLKVEAAGKVRVFAMVDWVTQTVMAPLHKALFVLLKRFITDGTFDQSAPVERLMSKGLKSF